jgi:CDP-L-myo-inositol myo-inositolphosphotransferase
LSHILVVFCSAATAEFRVAGIPAAARVARAISRIQTPGSPSRCVIATSGAWAPSHELREECRRLAPGLTVTFTARAEPRGENLTVAGELFIGALSRSRSDSPDGVLPALFEAKMNVTKVMPQNLNRERSCLAILRRSSRHIVASTGKAGDGVVSRFVNRPISQMLSRHLLQLSGMRPMHASVGTALLAVVMAMSLLLGGDRGLIAGAILFQSASIFDGVDGEVARATFRTSDQGAMVDSLIDAATNLLFVTGVSINLFLAGDLMAALAGGAGLVMLATGLFLIGRRARACGEPMNFDIIKGHMRRSRISSVLSECLIMLTMRDFFAAAAAALILVGWTHWALLAFAIVAAGWLLVSIALLIRTTRRRPQSWTRRAEALR